MCGEFIFFFRNHSRSMRENFPKKKKKFKIVKGHFKVRHIYIGSLIFFYFYLFYIIYNLLGCQDRLAEWDTKWSANIKENEERERVWLEKEREREERDREREERERKNNERDTDLKREMEKLKDELDIEKRFESFFFLGFEIFQYFLQNFLFFLFSLVVLKCDENDSLKIKLSHMETQVVNH